MKKLEAIATLVGATVGVGVLGMPYAVSKLGFWPGLGLLALLSVLNVILLLMYAEVTIRTKEDHEIPGYGELYLGHPAKITALFIGLMGSYGTMLAYLIAQGEVLAALFGGSATIWSLLFYAVATYIIYKGIDTVKAIELIMVLGMSIILAMIGLAAHPHIQEANFIHINLSSAAISYGIFLFALSGLSAIPQIRQQMRHSEKNIPLVIICASLIVFSMYAGFLWLVLGVTGMQTTHIATIGLGRAIGPRMILLGSALAFFTISTSCIAMGLSMRRLFQFDYEFSRLKATIVTIMVPLVLFLVGARNFIAVVGIVGGVILGVQNSLIVFAFWKALHEGDRRPEFTVKKLWWVGLVLLGVYVLGALATTV